ncbi:neprilysin-1-like isoform X1 [Ornithodoros turicata]|uniref:neprilysin-1-like isoform X1 n=1 Tax=Ornithodoros turicata TaxID=34597 RepID=UPI003139300D
MADSEAFIVVQEANGSPWNSSEQGTTAGQASNKTYAIVALMVFAVLVLGIASAAVWVLVNKEQSTTEKAHTPLSPGNVKIRKLSPKPRPPEANYGDYEDTNATPTERTSPLSEDVCDSDHCRYVREYFEAIIDTDKDPCDNFYAFTCGMSEQLRKSGVYVDKRYQNVATRNLTEAIQKNLEKEHIPARGRTPFQQSAALFRHCTQVDKNESAKAASDFLAQHQMDPRGSMSFDPLDVMVKFIFETNIPLIFKLEQEDFGSPNFTLRQITKVSLLLEGSSIGEIMSELFLTPVSDDLVQRITEAEHKRSEVSNMSRTGSPVSNGSNAVKVLELGKLGLENGDDTLSKAWTKALERYESSRPLQNMKISMTEADFRFFHRVFGKQRLISDEELRWLFAWRCILYLYEVAVYKTFWCINTVLGAMSVAAGSTTVFPILDEETVSAAREVAERIVNEIKESFKTCSWLDEETRSGALQKISKMKVRLGYPPKLNTSQKVDAFYKDFPDLNGPFVLDYLKLNAFQTKKDWKGAADGFSDYFYDLAVPLNANEANGFNMISSNFISVGVPFLMKPLFSAGGPPEINYGMLGFITTHEIMHGYDQGGRLRDGTGALSPWFTRKSLAEYKILERCYVEHIDSVPKARALVAFAQEYQADALGTLSLLRAYQKAARESRVHLGDVKGLSRDQLFYVALCVQWCGLPPTTSEGETHPPPDERCNVPLMNSAYFSRAFSCPPNSPMNPPQKCLFW